MESLFVTYLGHCPVSQCSKIVVGALIQPSDWTFLKLISLSLSWRLLGVCAFPCAYLIIPVSQLDISPITSFSDYILRREFRSEIILQSPFFSILCPNLFFFALE